MASKERDPQKSSPRKVDQTTPDWFPPPPKRKKGQPKEALFPKDLEHYFDDIRPEDLSLYTSMSLMSLMNHFSTWERCMSEGIEVDEDFDPDLINFDDDVPDTFQGYLDEKEQSAAYGSRLAVRLITETAQGEEPKIAINPSQAQMLSNLFLVDLLEMKKRYKATVQLTGSEGEVIDQFDVPLERRSVFAKNKGTVFISDGLAKKKGDYTLEIIRISSDVQKMNLDEKLTNDKS